jgi:hypothetical protein
MQAVTPWMSQLDIDPGSRWSTEISEQLAVHDIGIVCVTAQNLTEPWLHFEAGAISKSVQRGVAIPVLHGVSIADVQPTPLSQFQCVHSRNEEEMWLMIERLNESLDKPLSSDRLGKFFERSWAGYLEDLNLLDEGVDTVETPTRETSEVLNDILTRLGSHSTVLDEIVERLGFTFEVDGDPDYATVASIPSSLRSAPEVAEPTTDPFALVVGDVVQHPAFGVGTILEIQGLDDRAEVTVHFADIGTKHLALAWAPLRLIHAGPNARGSHEAPGS